MLDFSGMDLVVDKLCESMKNNPEQWTICTCTVDHKISGIKYWIGLTDTITEIWNGTSREEVFSKEQGDKLYAAVVEMKEKNGSEAQKKIINSVCVVENKIEAKNSWWRKIFN